MFLIWGSLVLLNCAGYCSLHQLQLQNPLNLPCNKVSVLQDAELCSGVPWCEDQGGEGHRAACECPYKPCSVSELAALVYLIANWLELGKFFWIGGAEGDRGADQDAAEGATGRCGADEEQADCDVG